jgi:S-formylglutathione hydrolase FrmB
VSQTGTDIMYRHAPMYMHIYRYVQRQLANVMEVVGNDASQTGTDIIYRYVPIYMHIYRYVQRQLANAMEVVGNDSSQTGTILFVLKLLTISIDNIQVSLGTH